LSGLLVRNLSTRQKIYFGPLYQQVQVVNSPERFIGQVQDERLNLPTLFREKPYLGMKLGYQLDSRDSRWLPTRGVHWLTEWQMWQGLGPNTRNLNRLSSELSLYWGFRLPARVTLATRLVGEFTGGSYEFFQAATLGGLTNLRGYRRMRFAGNSSAYNNTELRIRLGGFHTYLFPASFGILGFHDVGRVWLQGEASGAWHTGYGGGIWLAPFQQLVITASWGISREEQLPLIQLGFLF
jgi:outer membrane protein assembly factor BamA